MARATVVPEAIDYPDSDGLPMAENESQFWPILYVGSALDRYYQDREDVYVVGNLLLYYQRGDVSKSVSPDLMVVFGAPKHTRSSYRLWEEPKTPDFVLEIASESTYRAGRAEKRDLYAGMGISEYWQYDPVGTYLDPPLLGFRRRAVYLELGACRVQGMAQGRQKAYGDEAQEALQCRQARAYGTRQPTQAGTFQVQGLRLRGARGPERGAQSRFWRDMFLRRARRDTGREQGKGWSMTGRGNCNL